MVPKVYAGAMLATAFIFWALSHHEASHVVSKSIGMTEQLQPLKDPRVWKYCQESVTTR